MFYHSAYLIKKDMWSFFMQKSSGGEFSGLIKGALLSVCVACAMILVFALVLKFSLLSSGAIKVINQFIKSLSMLFGCFFFVRERWGLIKGAILGLIFALLINLLFLFFSSSALDFGKVALDVVFCAAVGAIFGILCVNLSKSR